MVNIEIVESSIPIVWIDTSIITNMTIAKANPGQLDELTYHRVTELHRNIREASRKGKVICPLASQELEVWIDRKLWLETIYDLGMGIRCVCGETIKEIQFNAAIKAYVHKDSSVKLSYLDIFFSDPVKELNYLLSQPFFITVDSGLLFGADYQRAKKKRNIAEFNDHRARNVSNGVSYSEQLEREYVGELEALMISANRLASGKYDSADPLNDLYGYSTLMEQLGRLAHYSGKKNDLSGLIDFYNSEYNKVIPCSNIGAQMFAKIKTDPQAIKTGDPMDIEHASSILPYADLFITDNYWKAFLNNKKIGKQYDTQVCYIGDSSEINQFFSGL